MSGNACRNVPEKKLLVRLWPVPALLVMWAAAALLGLAAAALLGRGALPAPPQKQRADALTEKSAFSRPRLAAPADAPRQPAVAVFAALFGGRASAGAYCGAVSGAFETPAIRGRAHLWSEVRLPVPEVMQLPQLPNGCEAASLAALLQYRGFSANELDLAYAYIPREDFAESFYTLIGPDPERAYPGDPATGLGFYCFAAPLAQGANRYLREMGASMHAFNITGVTQEGLKQYLRGGDPVVVWVTLDFSEPYTGDFAWMLQNTGQVYTPYLNVHCVVLTGWSRDTCTLMDPLQGTCTVDRREFWNSFEQMGRRAMVVH